MVRRVIQYLYATCICMCMHLYVCVCTHIRIQRPVSELCRSEGFPNRTGYFVPVRYGLGVWPDWRVVGAPSPPSPSAPVGNSIPKHINFDICSEISSSGPSHQIRLVKLVSNFPMRDKVNRKCCPKSIFFIKKTLKSTKFPHFYRLARVSHT